MLGSTALVSELMQQSHQVTQYHGQVKIDFDVHAAMIVNKKIPVSISISGDVLPKTAMHTH